MASLHSSGRKCHIDRLGCKTQLLRFLFYLFLRFFEPGLDFRADIIDHLSDLRAVFLGNILHAAQDSGQRTFLSKNIHADAVNVL